MTFKVRNPAALAIIGALAFSAASLAAGEDWNRWADRLSHSKTRLGAFQEADKRRPEVLPGLLKLCDDRKRSRDARVGARLALGRLGGDQVREKLEKHLSDEADPLERESSAIGLGYAGDKRSIPALRRARKDRHGNVRMRAIWALARMGDKSGKDQAVQAIESRDVTEQVLAVEALESFGEKDVIPSLKKKFSHPNPYTRINAKMAVARLESKELVGPERVAYMEKILQVPEYEIQRWAAHQLAQTAVAGESADKEIIGRLANVAQDHKHPGQHAAWKEINVLLASGKLKEADLK